MLTPVFPLLRYGFVSPLLRYGFEFPLLRDRGLNPKQTAHAVRWYMNSMQLNKSHH
jgi:hypothetical protein